MEKRPWTAEEDKLLKYVYETSRLTKWSHIARRLMEDHGVKGRNGKHCKERYAPPYAAMPSSIQTTARTSGHTRTNRPCLTCITSSAINGQSSVRASPAGTLPYM